MAEPPPESGRTIAHYTIERVIGHGSVGTVYLAHDRRIGRKVALKHVVVDARRFEDERDEADFFHRLQREVEVCGRLNHVNLVTLYDVGYENGRVSYLAMELVDGPSLLEMIKSRRPQPIPVDQVLGLATQILRGLASAHAAGIVHRDIKPANVLVTRDGQAKIADFGIARPDDSSLTATGTLMGTPNYMSPEQVQGHPTTTKSDLFSFGAVLYEMLTGQKPFAASDVTGVLYKVVAQPHAAIVSDAVPGRLARLVDRLLAKSPDARPGSAREVLEEIAAIAAGMRGSTALGEPAPDDRSTADATVLESAKSGGPEARCDDTTERSSGLTILRRPVSARSFWGVAGSLAAILLVVVVAIGTRIDETPTAVIPEEALLEFAAKKEALAAAAGLCAEGLFDECVAAYDAYLERYPNSIAAASAREEALLRRRQAPPGAGETVRVTPREDDPSGWQRFKKGVKRVFGRK